MYDFVAIGDIVTDAFIKLKDASVHCDINHEHCTITMAFGDKIPYESVEEVPAVGNSANAAVSASRLGLKSALVTNMGDDENGRNCLASLKKDSVATEFVSLHQGKITNYHYVLWYEDERTILVKHEDYPYDLPDIDNPKWIYFSSIGENSLSFHAVVAEFLRRNPDVKFAFQPGTFQIKFGTEALAAIYQRTDVFIANKEEYKQILKTDETDIKKLMRQMGEIARINKKFLKSDFRILTGAEVNIMKDGALDISDDVLAKLDVVGAAVHSHFGLPRDEQTKRVIRAMENKNVDIIFHLTGRLINKREPIDIDFEEILKVAKRTGTILEINAWPERADIRDEYIRKCVDAGVKMSIDSDAHSKDHFKLLEYGIAQARRGWAEKGDIINAWPVEKMLEFLK